MNARSQSRNRKALGTMRIAFFCVVLLAPLAGMFIAPPERIPSMPRSAYETEAFLIEIQLFFRNNFGLRETLSDIHGQTMRTINGSALVKNKIVIGEEGWLYLKESRRINDFRMQEGFTQKQFNSWRETLTAIQSFADRKSIPYIPVIIPSKFAIYAEYLPEIVRERSGDIPRIDVLDRFLRTKCSLPNLLTMSELFRQHRLDWQLYFKTDPHCTRIGAFLTYRTIMDQLGELGFDAKLPSLASLNVSTNQALGGTAASALGTATELVDVAVEFDYPNARRVLLGEKPVPSMPITGVYRDYQIWGEENTIVTQCADAEFESAVVFHDSHGLALIPYLGQHFKRIRFVWGEFAEERIDDPKPDAIIHVMAGQGLWVNLGLDRAE
jgi:alginate O-acetyltransferase complex protein AlgJ